MHILKIVFYDVIVTIHRISPSIGRGNKVWIFLGSLKKKVTTSEYKGYYLETFLRIVRTGAG